MFENFTLMLNTINNSCMKITSGSSELNALFIMRAAATKMRANNSSSESAFLL